MKTIKHLLILLLAWSNFASAQVSIGDSKNSYHSGVGIYPVSFYEFGNNIKWNYVLTKKNHDFYIGFSTHINGDTERWSNTQAAFRNNGIARNFIQYFHPNIGYTKYISFKRGFPVTFILNPDFQLGQIFKKDKIYYGNGGLYNEKAFRILDYDGFQDVPIKYWQFSLNIGLKIDITKQIQINSKAGLGLSHINLSGDIPYTGFQFPIVYSVGVNYIFRK